MLLYAVFIAIAVRCLLSASFLFVAAGTVNWIEGWILIVVSSGLSGAAQLLLAKKNPALASERMKPGPGRVASDRFICAILAAGFNIWLAAIALDAIRFGWSNIPEWLKWIGVLLVLAGQYISYSAQRTNDFASSVVRIQHDRDQMISVAGPYRIVRHPIYAANTMLFIGGALLGGSWIGVGVAIVLGAVFAVRLLMEERALLHAFPEYALYGCLVRSRLIPFLW